VPGAVPWVKQLVKDNRTDDFIEVRPWAGDRVPVN
jgi:hypothetical protein